MSAPSKKALENAIAGELSVHDYYQRKIAVRRAHDDVLGLDGSICKRDVVEWLVSADSADGVERADAFEREFGGGS